MKISQRLDKVNEHFYHYFADQFHQSRNHGWIGWRPLLDELPCRSLRVLDIGCGNGRLAHFLNRSWCEQRGGEIIFYNGLDQNKSLLKRAGETSWPFPAEWSSWSWSSIPELKGKESRRDKDDVLERYDWVTLFGVLHHVFGYERRLRLIQWAAQHLRPNGVLSISLWDFGAHSKWEKKYLNWSDYISDWGIALEEIEEGDHLLGWSGDRSTPRYCHWVNRTEEERLISEVDQSMDGLSAGWRVGAEGDLNRYWCWRLTEPTQAAHSPLHSSLRSQAEDDS